MPDNAKNWEHCLKVAAVSDLGLRRSNNQDSLMTVLARDEEDWQEAGHLFVVADGMGAHAAGELASKLAVEQVTHLYRKHIQLSAPAAIVAAIKEANEEIHRRGQANLAFHNMGTTCSALILLPQGALAAHVGDSRIYRLRDNQLHQLTFDHSLVWEMRQLAKQSEAETAGIPKNVITRSLGPNPEVKVDLEGPFAVERGDAFLLCSDGLTGCVTDSEIASVLANYEPEPAAQLLVNLANIRGAPDNTSIIIAKIVGREQTTAASRAAPLTIGEVTEAATVPLMVWIGFGVAVLLSCGLWAVGNGFWALMMLAIAALPGLWILAVELGITRDGGLRLSGGRRLGRAPYQKATATNQNAFFTQLHSFIDQAIETSKTREWEVDWTTIEQQRDRSQQLYDEGAKREALDALLQSSEKITEFYRQHARMTDAK